ncbi:MAG: NfeD family protein [Rhodocyclaceae bacterium]|nr:NfeD family protein [Rhodocyclaceae bacterium]
MDFELLWWHWIVLAVGLALAELAIPSFFVIWFGAGAVLVGLVTLLVHDLSLAEQLSIWILASLAMVYAWFRVFRTNRHKTRIGMAEGEVIGEVGLLVREVAPFQRGSVRFQKPLLGAEEWVCIGDEAIVAGERVRVVAIEGSILKVARSAKGDT